LLPLAAVLVLIPSAVFFFQSGEYVKDAEDLGSDSLLASDGVSTRGELRTREAVQSAKVAAPSKTPSQLLEEAFAAMSAMEIAVRAVEGDALIVKLRAAGPAGLDAVRKFLASGRDVRFRDGYAFSGSRMVQAPTMRSALIESLREWPGSTAVLLELLRSKGSVWESALVIRNLEKQNPGTYRHEAIHALRERIADPSRWDSTPATEAIVFEVARHFQAEELLPQIHALTTAQPVFHVPSYVQMLNGFSDNVRSAAIDRLLAEPKVTEALLGHPYLMNQFSFVDERMRAFAGNAFTQVWNGSQKLNGLQGFDATPPSGTNTFFGDPRDSNWSGANVERDLKETRARKVLLMEIEPAADTPELQQALKKARQAVISEIGKLEMDRRYDASQPAEIEFASGAGKATIKGRQIENIEINSVPVIPKVDDADSTPEPGR
jgi:hypothetical protein